MASEVVALKAAIRDQVGDHLLTPKNSAMVVIADDQTLVRAGLRMILESQADMEVVAEAGNGERGSGRVQAAPSGCRPDGCQDAKA